MNSTKNLNIKIKTDALRESIRAAARAEGWATEEGFKDWARDKYNAKLEYGGEFTASRKMVKIKFKTEQDYIMFSLKHGVR